MAESPARSFRQLLPGPLGALTLHASLIFLLFHFDTIRDACAQRTVAEMDWVWLPEVTLAPEPAPPPEPPPPPPEPIPEPVPEPPPDPAVSPEPLPEPLPPVAEPPPPPIEKPPPPPVDEPPPLEQVVENVSEPAPPPAAAAPASASEIPDAWTPVREEIMKSLRYPAYARRNGVSGVAILLLKLDRSGHLVSVTIQPPAPAKSLCDAVMAAVRQLGPFPELGEAIRQGQAPAQAEIAIRFELAPTGR